MLFIGQILTQALPIVLLAEPTGLPPACQDVSKCISQAHDLFSSDRAVEALRVLTPVLETDSQGEFVAVAGLIIYQCSSYDAKDGQEALFVECRKVLDKYYEILRRVEDEELQKDLEATKARIGWQEKLPPTMDASKPPTAESLEQAHERDVPKPVPSPVPDDGEKRPPSASEGKQDRQTAWILVAASVSTALAIPLTVIGTKVIIDAHNTRLDAFQTERFLTEDAADRAAFVADFDNYVQERTRGGGTMIATGATLGLGSAVLFTVATTRLRRRRGQRRQTDIGSSRQRSLGVLIDPTSAFFALQGRF